MSPTSSASEVGWWASVVSMGVAALTFILVLVRMVRKAENMDNEIKSLKTSLKEVLKLFTDQDGEPRFVTVVVCNNKSSACGALSGEKFSHVGERITALTLEITSLRSDMKTTQDETLRVILAELRKDARRGE